MVLPLALLLSRRTRELAGVQIAAAGMVLVALFIGRYEFIVDGQSVPVFKGTWAGEFASYSPSVTEVMIAVLSAAIVVTLYAIGEKYLRLDAAPATDDTVAFEAAQALAHASARDDTAQRAQRPLAGSTAD
jgi:molybdopterin-containing oxidoreductase family membrane subunit